MFMKNELKISRRQRLQIAFVRLCIFFQNVVLRVFCFVLFRRVENPRAILIYKVGNIGDIVCAVPCFVAIRKAYPKAHITLLTSPGEKGASGAYDLLQGAGYFDEIHVYYNHDVRNLAAFLKFARTLRGFCYDLFIQIPDDWASFTTLFRNLIFAKYIGARMAFGFEVRTFLHLFMKTQIDCFTQEQETASLLRMLSKYGIHSRKVCFDIPISKADEDSARGLLEEAWGDNFSSYKMLVGIHMKSKRREKEWSSASFGRVMRYLEDQYRARFIIFGGGGDVSEAWDAAYMLRNEQNACIVAGRVNLKQALATLQYCHFVVCIDSGIMHMAASLGKPCVALFSTFNILGRWFPYRTNHEIIFHRGLSCDYRDPVCVKQSMDRITEEEVIQACERVIARL